MVFDPSLCSDLEKLKLVLKPSSMYRGEPRSRYCPVTKCILWRFSVDGSGYPEMKLGVEFNERFGSSPINPVKILLSIYFSVKLDTPNYEISHLCHTKLCIQTEHISYEPKWINARRKKCHENKICSKDHFDEESNKKFPDCVHFLND